HTDRRARSAPGRFVRMRVQSSCSPIVSYHSKLTIYRGLPKISSPLRLRCRTARALSAPASVPEVAYAGGYHRGSRRVHGGHDILVAHRPPRLDEGGGARLDRELGTVGKREEGVGGEHRAREQLRLGRACLLDRDAHRIYAAHLAGPDAD